MIEERKSTTINQNIVQNIVLENREKLNLFILIFSPFTVSNPNSVSIITTWSSKLNTSEVIVDGEISSLTYSQKAQEKNGGTSLLSKIFK